MIQHVDNTATTMLVNHIFFNEKQKPIILRKEWDKKIFEVKYLDYFIPIPYENISLEEETAAKKAMDEWILSYYKLKPEDPQAANYEIPKDIDDIFPGLYEHYWEILSKLNQNQRAKKYILNSPIKGFEDLNILFTIGKKVLTPFKTDEKNYYEILTLKGRSQDMTRFHQSIGK